MSYIDEQIDRQINNWIDENKDRQMNIYYYRREYYDFLY